MAVDAAELDDVLRALWQSTYERGRGYELEDVHRAVEEVAGSALVPMLRRLVAGPLDPELEACLASVGVLLEAQGRPADAELLLRGRPPAASSLERPPRSRPRRSQDAPTQHHASRGA